MQGWIIPLWLEHGFRKCDAEMLSSYLSPVFQCNIHPARIEAVVVD